MLISVSLGSNSHHPLLLPYQTNTQKENLKDSSDRGGANDVAITHGRHGHHEKVNTLPVAEFVNVAKIGRVTAILQLRVPENVTIFL